MSELAFLSLSDASARLRAGTLSPVEFFAPEHIGRIMAAAHHDRAVA